MLAIHVSARTDLSTLIAFLRWGLTKGQDFLEPLSYARLPAALIAREQAALNKLSADSAAGVSRER